MRENKKGGKKGRKIHYCGRNHFFVEWFFGKSLWVVIYIYIYCVIDERCQPKTTNREGVDD